MFLAYPIGNATPRTTSFCELFRLGAKMTNTDEGKGRLKEAAGDLTNDKDLKREGKIDRAAGKAKDTVDRAADKLKDAASSDE